MEKATLIRAMLAIKPNLDKRGYFTSKSLAYSLRVSKARTSVIVASLIQGGYCRKIGARDLVLTEKGVLWVEAMESDLARIALNLNDLSPIEAKQVSRLIYAYGGTRLVEQLLKAK